jgi:hypothetical protein
MLVASGGPGDAARARTLLMAAAGSARQNGYLGIERRATASLGEL